MSKLEPPPQDAPRTGSAGQPDSDPKAGESILLPGFLPPEQILDQLSQVRPTQPVAALAAVNQHRAPLTEAFLKAIERGLTDPMGNFAKDGMLFNYAAYFLSKWREKRAYPLFIRWFSLPGEAALELGGDTLTQHGGRFLASVWGGSLDPIKELILNPDAHPAGRGQGLTALAVLTLWNEVPRGDAEAYLLWLAREALPRRTAAIWSDLAAICVSAEFRGAFPELRRAIQEGIIPTASLSLEELEKAEQAPPEFFSGPFARAVPPVTDVIEETRWWAGFQQSRAAQTQARPGLAQPYLAAEKPGRNDLCPCGSGKKFKKCCGR